MGTRRAGTEVKGGLGLGSPQGLGAGFVTGAQCSLLVILLPAVKENF